jgi:hypothetical protein
MRGCTSAGLNNALWVIRRKSTFPSGTELEQSGDQRFDHRLSGAINGDVCLVALTWLLANHSNECSALHPTGLGEPIAYRRPATEGDPPKL